MEKFILKWEIEIEGKHYGDFIHFYNEPTKEEVMEASIVLLRQAKDTYDALNKGKTSIASVDA